MLELSNKYYAAIDEGQKTLIAAAGEAMLARGSHGSLGVFIGFMASTIASLFMSWVILHGKIINKVTSYIGLVGNALLLIYILLITFVPALEKVAIMMAAPGGILALVWILLLGISMIRSGVAAEDN